MKTHAGALTSTPSNAQTNDSDTSEDPNRNTGLKENKQGLVKSPEKGAGTDPLPVSVGSEVVDEPIDSSE